MKSAILLLALAVALPCAATTDRSQVEKGRFARAHQCPSTGLKKPSCPGYVIDHIMPLCGGGADKASNMQWQDIADAKRKDARERRYCSCLRAHRAVCTFTP
ncbi:MAG: HNH endonuclease signature motif containing protein [Usitatibacter sp.]